MGDYTQYEDYSVKDGLATTDPEKTILGTDIDEELSRISTAIASKVDEPSSPSTNDVLTYDGASWIAQAGNFAPVGVVVPYAGASAPSGWLLCYGQAVSQSTYSDLWTVLGGHIFGADPGSGNFLLPDLRFRVPIGYDDMNASAGRDSGVTYDYGSGAIGANGGQATVTISTNQIPAHSHGAGSLTVTGGSHDHDIQTIPTDSGVNTGITEGSSDTALSNNTTAVQLDGGHSHTVGGSTANNTTTGSAIETIPGFTVFTYIIKF